MVNRGGGVRVKRVRRDTFSYPKGNPFEVKRAKRAKRVRVRGLFLVPAYSLKRIW